MYSVYFGKLCHSNAVYINSILTLLFFKVYPDFRRFSQNIVLSHQSACEPRELLYMVGTFGTESAVR